ncbi:MAG TPA: outer membrane protein assembly factor BamA [Alphaproteobacteria bacterium]|nr:outer membrane protein assembly factor BamA [Alphaproteobacteria bacterium]
MRQLVGGLVGVTLALMLLWPAPGHAETKPPAGADVIQEIRVEGTNRIEVESVLSYMLIKPGDPFDPQRMDASLKALFATGLFSDVTLRREGGALVVRVVENPVINRLAFEGNKKVKSEDLQNEVELKPRTVYTRTKVQNDVKRILEIYRATGRFAATVTPKVIPLPQNRVDLVYEINEGDVTAVRRISFIGNKVFSDSRLREVIQTEETAWWKFFTTNDTYDPDRLNFDREQLRKFYLSQGYADFRVISAVAELTPDRKEFFITFTIDEGRRYKFGKIDIVSTIPDLNADQLRSELKSKEGDWYNADLVENSINSVTTAAGTLGYAFVDVRPQVKRDREAGTIDITYEVREGPKVFVERIDITGNQRTRDEVIRRELRISEGDAFNASNIRVSRRRLRNLNFFDNVDITNEPGSAPDKTVLKVAVTEKATGEVSLGGGFSTNEGVLGTFGLRERNFLGRGQDVQFNFTVSQKSQNIDLRYTEPYLFDRNLIAGWDIFRVKRDFTDESGYQERRTGGRLRAGYEIVDDVTQVWRYTIQTNTIANLNDNASQFIQQEKGTTSTSAIGQTLTFDKRDDRQDPTSGYFVSLDFDGAGLGGSERFAKSKVTAGTYYPIAPDWVLSAIGEVGYVHGLFGKDVRLANRFFLGGDNLRGFKPGGVGPRDNAVGDSLGANKYYAGTLEVSFPLGLPREFGIRGRAFTDFGSAWDVDLSGPGLLDVNTIRVSAGVGISWKSPFGPVRIDVGVPIKKESFDDKQLIRFSFGTRF